MKLDVIRAIEACYSGPADDASWLGGVLEALRPLDQGPGLLAWSFRIAPNGSRVKECSAATGHGERSVMLELDEERERFCASTRDATAAQRFFVPIHFPDYALKRAVRFAAPWAEAWRAVLGRAGMSDSLGILASEPDGRTVIITTATPVGCPLPSPRLLHQLRLFTAHLGSAMRLRHAVSGAPPDTTRDEAVLDPAGKILDAIGGARRPAARQSLAEAVRRMDHARGALRRIAPEEALLLWQGLVDGRWSLVDQCDADGKRFILARRNDPVVRDPKALVGHERSVVAFAAMGHQNKFIAYLLGLSPSAVASHLVSAERKLGLSSRAELIARLGFMAEGVASNP